MEKSRTRRDERRGSSAWTQRKLWTRWNIWWIKWMIWTSTVVSKLMIFLILCYVLWIFYICVEIYCKSLLIGNFFLPLFFNTVFCIWALIESGTSRGVSWKPNSSHKLVNAFHLSPLLRRHHKIKERSLFHKIHFYMSSHWSNSL